MEFWKSTSIAIALQFTTCAYSATISTDWKIINDNLITTDTVSGLDWLDLTETNGLSYNTVVSELGTNGRFSGFRYATDTEVLDLWNNFDIDLSPRKLPTYGFIDSGIVSAGNMLGNTVNDFNPNYYTFGALGLSVSSPLDTSYNVLGAYHYIPDAENYYSFLYSGNWVLPYDSGLEYGSYLVRNTVIPIPASIWLFATGIISLIALARKRS